VFYNSTQSSLNPRLEVCAPVHGGDTNELLSGQIPSTPKNLYRDT